MQLSKNIIFIIIMTLSNLVSANLEMLASGISCDADFSSRPEAEKGVIRNIGSTFSVNNIDSGVSCKAWAGSSTMNNWFELSSDLELYGVNVDTKQYLGNWPLTLWANSVRMKGEGTNWKARPIIAGALGGDTTEITDPKVMVLNTQKYALPAFKEFMGCLASTPLRYGDIDNNSSNELVLILDDQLVVFSPQLQKTTFATQFSVYDELKPEEVDAWFDLKQSEVETQYVAKSGVGNRLNAAFPATRSFAKIFFDDFDGNGKPDIIVWRKLYESRLKADAINGFKLEGELFVHYQLENGEYQLQTQAPAVNNEFGWDQIQQDQIKGWLTAKNQTWQSGFPSKSECAGQEGQLIPEMHDPLLNDPDVLK